MKEETEVFVRSFLYALGWFALWGLLWLLVSCGSPTRPDGENEKDKCDRLARLLRDGDIYGTQEYYRVLDEFNRLCGNGEIPT